MMPKSLICGVVLASAIGLISSCSLHEPRDLQIDQTHQTYLEEIRLGDGVPLDLTINLRWKVKDRRNFSRQFTNIDTYHQKILIPRSQEIVATLSNQFLSVDSVFGSQRQAYLARIKNDLNTGLEDGLVSMKEVIIAQVRFPDAYTMAKEDIGMRNQELAHIQEQNKVDLAQAEADRKRTEASNKIRIAQAEADGKLEKIQTQMEKDRRAIALARAETDRQVEKMKTDAESERRLVLAKAELAKQRDLKNLELEKRREIDQVGLTKVANENQLLHEQQMQLAKLCTENPIYASFLVNRELAGQVEIAVLPTGTDPNVFKDLLHHNMPSHRKIGTMSSPIETKGDSK